MKDKIILVVIVIVVVVGVTLVVKQLTDINKVIKETSPK